MERTFMCVDLKSFYASVECRERGLDPMKTNLVVADAERTEKTICLAVSPSLKKYGIPGRARLFEVVQKVKNVNFNRQKLVRGHVFEGSSCNDDELKANPNLKLDYIAAVPRMALYMQYSTQIYNIYLKYLSSEDIYVYSVDEVFCDLTRYLKTYKMTAEELTTKMILDVLETTGITATAGIGTNMYLAKIAMDIGAKHVKPNKHGVRIAALNEKTYRYALWGHTPITDFWRVGKGYAKRLAENGMYTMGDVALCSIKNEDLLYKLFGVNAELLIDHAWGWEPCTIEDVKAYKPTNNSISSGQVLHCPYDFQKAKLIVREMTDLLVLDLVDKGLLTNQVVLTVVYDKENLENKDVRSSYKGEIVKDRYGRNIPKHAHGTINLEEHTSSTKIILAATMELYDRIINKNLTVRQIYVVANHVIREENFEKKEEFKQLDLFTDYKKLEEEQKSKIEKLKKERSLQHTVINIKKKYGKNAILKGMNFIEGGTTIERNKQVGGHRE